MDVKARSAPPVLAPIRRADVANCAAFNLNKEPPRSRAGPLLETLSRSGGTSRLNQGGIARK